MHTVVIAVLVLQLLEGSQGVQRRCLCPTNLHFNVTCKTENTWLHIDKQNCASQDCFYKELCCRYNVDGIHVFRSTDDAPGKCPSLESKCSLEPSSINCDSGKAEWAKCFVICKSVTDVDDTTVPSFTQITAENTTLATAPATSPAKAPATSPAIAPDDDDNAFPVAAAVAVSVAIVAVAAIIVAVILRCRCKNASKGDPDINNRPMHNGVMDNALVNPSYNENDIGENRTQASTPAANVAPDYTEYAECGSIDECLNPVGQKVRQELGNKPGKIPLERDPYDHVRQYVRSITRDPNYAHLEMEVLDKEYSHITSVGESNDGNMDNGRIADINTYTHLETNSGTASVRQPSIPTEYDQKGQHPGNVYMTLQPVSQQTVLRGDNEKVTTDHSTHEYVQLGKGGHCVAKTVSEYTDLLGVGNGTSSTYQTLAPTTEHVNDRIKLNESPVIADAKNRTSVSHDYCQLISSGEGSNGNLADAEIADVNSYNHLETTVANTWARGNGMRTESNQEISPDMTKDIINGKCPGNLYMTLEPDSHQTALKVDYEQATTDYMPHEYVQLEKGESDTAETAVEYTGPLNVDNRTPSEYQTLEPTADPINNIIELSESPVIADAQYFTLTS